MDKKDILELSKLTIEELKQMADQYHIEHKGYKKQQIIYLILDKQTKQ